MGRTCVAGRGLDDDGSTWDEETVVLCGVNHGSGYSVLDGTTDGEIFGLAHCRNVG